MADTAPTTGPWTRYQAQAPQTPQAPQQGPWTRYQAAPQEASREPEQQVRESGPVSGAVAQFGAGSQVGIARGLGFPVDAVTGGINALGGVTGLWDPIERPFLGSEHIDSMISPLRANVAEPSGAFERGVRRVGEEVGAGAAMAPLGMLAPGASAAPGAFLLADTASSVGAGVGSAVANEVAPGSVTAEFAGALLGGLPAGYAAARGLGVTGTDATVRGGIEEQRAIAGDAYQAVRADGTTLPQAGVDDMALDMRQAAIDAGMDVDNVRYGDSLTPRAFRTSDVVLDRLSSPQTVADIEETRRYISRSLMTSTDPNEQRLGRIMMNRIDEYYDTLDGDTVARLMEGRDAYRRTMAAETIENAAGSAELRAASTGTGGNEINALRQNLRRILENPRIRSSFNQEQLDSIEEIVRGTGGTNALRHLSRMAPTSSGAASFMHLLGASALPPWLAMPMALGSQGAKALGERQVRNALSGVVDSIAPSRIVEGGRLGARNALAASEMVNSLGIYSDRLD